MYRLGRSDHPRLSAFPITAIDDKGYSLAIFIINRRRDHHRLNRSLFDQYETVMKNNEKRHVTHSRLTLMSSGTDELKH